MKGTSFCLLAALLMACATTQPPPPPSQLVVKNGSDKTYRLSVNRDYLMEIGPARAILVRNLPNSPYTLRAQNGPEELAADIDPGQGDALLEFPIPGQATVVNRTASLKLENPTRQDLELTIGEEPIGRSFAGTTTLFEALPAGPGTVTFTNLVTRGRWQRSIDLPPLQQTVHTIAAPVATLRFSNDAKEALTLKVLRDEYRLVAGQKQVIANLPPGLLQLHIRFHGTGRTMVLDETLQPGEEKDVLLSDASGNITVENRLPMAAEILMAGDRIATVESTQSYTIRGLAPGRLILTAQGGPQHFEQPFLITPDSNQTWLLEEGNTQLLVKNRIGETVTLFVDDRKVMEILDQQAVRFPVKPGPHSLAANCEATGHTTHRHIDVPGGRLVDVTFGPLPGRLYLENRTEKTLRFFRNGKPVDMLAPGEWAEHGGLPLGTSLLEVLDEKGATLLSRPVVIRTRQEPRSEVVVNSIESQLRIRNETGETIRIGPPARTANNELANDHEAIVFMPGSKGVLKMKGTHTSNRYDRLFEATEGEVLDIVLAPVTGGIVVENTTESPMDILLDGQPWATLAAGETLRRDRVAPGLHRLVAKRKGTAFEEVSCRLVQDSWYVWRIQEKTASVHVLNRTKESLKLLRDESPTGILQPGTEVRFDGITPGPVDLSAVGLESGQHYRFSVQARPDRTTQWKILPASGGVHLLGFEKQAATISINGTEVLAIPEGVEEPVALPLEPGIQTLRIRFPDGRDVVGIVRVAANLYATLHVLSGAPRVTLRNDTGQPLTVFLDGIKVDRVHPGKSREFVVEHPGKHSVTARHDDGNGEWALKDVYLDAGRAFGWTVAE
jgi:hypothetical protein